MKKFSQQKQGLSGFWGRTRSLQPPYAKGAYDMYAAGELNGMRVPEQLLSDEAVAAATQEMGVEPGRYLLLLPQTTMSPRESSKVHGENWSPERYAKLIKRAEELGLDIIWADFEPSDRDLLEDVKKFLVKERFDLNSERLKTFSKHWPEGAVYPKNFAPLAKGSAQTIGLNTGQAAVAVAAGANVQVIGDGVHDMQRHAHIADMADLHIHPKQVDEISAEEVANCLARSVQAGLEV